MDTEKTDIEFREEKKRPIKIDPMDTEKTDIEFTEEKKRPIRIDAMDLVSFQEKRIEFREHEDSLGKPSKERVESWINVNKKYSIYLKMKTRGMVRNKPILFKKWINEETRYGE
jgi:hypothetical protein